MKGFDAKEERARREAWDLIRTRIAERTGIAVRDFDTDRVSRVDNMTLEDIHAGGDKYREVSRQ